MSNDVLCKTVGIGNIYMRMFDGHVRTFMNVRHIPNLKKNLLSLRALKAQECKFSGTDGGFKVTKGSMLILKRERTANLYMMTKSIIVGDVSVATEKDGTIRLWHMHFRHMSERGIQVMHNNGALPGIKYCKLDLCSIMVR